MDGIDGGQVWKRAVAVSTSADFVTWSAARHLGPTECSTLVQRLSTLKAPPRPHCVASVTHARVCLQADFGLTDAGSGSSQCSHLCI